MNLHTMHPPIIGSCGNNKEKVKLEKSLKRKSMENLPVPKKRKSKFTGRVGVADEAKSFVTNISVLEKKSVKCF